MFYAQSTAKGHIRAKTVVGQKLPPPHPPKQKLPGRKLHTGSASIISHLNKPKSRKTSVYDNIMHVTTVQSLNSIKSHFNEKINLTVTVDHFGVAEALNLNKVKVIKTGMNW